MVGKVAFHRHLRMRYHFDQAFTAPPGHLQLVGGDYRIVGLGLRGIRDFRICRRIGDGILITGLGGVM